MDKISFSNAQDIIDYPEVTIILCEDRKNRDAAEWLLPIPEYIFICLDEKVKIKDIEDMDWSIIKNRSIMYWGISVKVRKFLLEISKRNNLTPFKMVNKIFGFFTIMSGELYRRQIRKNIPPRYLALDAINEGWTPELLESIRNERLSFINIRIKKTDREPIVAVCDVKCIVCNSIFRHLPHRKFCSLDCKKAFTRKQRTKKCVNCLKEFIGKDNKAVACSQICANKITGKKNTKDEIEIKCKVCGNLFKGKAYLIKKRTVCSVECRHSLYKNPLVHKNCVVCYKEFKTRSSRIKNICCSRECVNIHQTKIVEDKNCLQCGIVFKPHKYAKWSEVKYCSTKCTSKSLVKPRKKLCCHYCKSDYSVIPANEEKSKFCSRPCRQKFGNGSKFITSPVNST